MHTVQKSQVILNPEDKTKLIAFASDLQLPPAHWPDFIAVVDEQEKGFMFGGGRREFVNNDFVGVLYTTSNGAYSLIVFND